MADIAKMSGVSVSTVSRALAGSDQVSADTREYIAEIARQNGYVVNPLARSLRLKRTEIINVAIPLGHASQQLISDPFMLEMLGRLADEITERGYELLVTKMPAPEPGWLDRLVGAQRADGLIIIGQSDQCEALQEAGRHHEPMVVWGAHKPGMSYSVVGVDNRLGGRLAAERLIGRGRRKLAFIGDPTLPEVRPRYAGYLEVCDEAGVPEAARRLAYAAFTPSSAQAAAELLFESGEPVDGIFAASDVIALEAIAAAKARGLRIPDDVAVVGFDDSAVAAHADPALTTIRQDLAEGARLLTELLFQRMQGAEPAGVQMTPQLVVRASA